MVKFHSLLIETETLNGVVCEYDGLYHTPFVFVDSVRLRYMFQ